MPPTSLTIQVWHKGEIRIAQYGDYHGWPEGQGIAIVNFLNNTGSGNLQYPCHTPEPDHLRYGYYEVSSWTAG